MLQLSLSASNLGDQEYFPKVFFFIAPLAFMTLLLFLSLHLIAARLSTRACVRVIYYAQVHMTFMSFPFLQRKNKQSGELLIALKYAPVSFTGIYINFYVMPLPSSTLRSSFFG